VCSNEEFQKISRGDTPDPTSKAGKGAGRERGKGEGRLGIRGREGGKGEWGLRTHYFWLKVALVLCVCICG